jgi:hypothetical protein
MANNNYLIELNSKEFFTIWKNAIDNNLTSLYPMLLSALKKEPSLLNDLLDIKISGSKQIEDMSIVEYVLQKNQIDFVNLFLNTNKGKSIVFNQMKNIVSKSDANIIQLENVNGVFYFIRQMLTKNNCIVSNAGEGVSGSDFPLKVQPVMEVWANLFLEAKDSDQELLKKFLNLKIKDNSVGKSNKKTSFIYTPVFFSLLHLFENKVPELEKANLINWDNYNEENQTIIYKCVDYCPQLINLIIEKDNISGGWKQLDINGKTPLMYLTNYDMGKYINATRWEYIIDNNVINWDDYKVEYKAILSRVISSYCSNNVKNQNHSDVLINLYMSLLNQPLAQTSEIKNILTNLQMSDSKSVKVKELNSIYLSCKLDDNLNTNQAIVKKHKI